MNSVWDILWDIQVKVRLALSAGVQGKKRMNSKIAFDE